MGVLPFSELRRLTGPNVGAVLSEEATVIVPFRKVCVDWPASAKLGYTLSCKYLSRATINRRRSILGEEVD